MKKGILGNIAVDLGGGIGVYGGENAFWTLLRHRKMTKKRPIYAHFYTTYDHFFTKTRRL